ncbi:MAG: chemosensory pili system protein ChpA (sensor histidine kinase/response regulator) [Candidatus Endobugula sp.]|jgi:chemosensory pili system protein ChpA (sensor histidine kinase/response regulator)
MADNRQYMALEWVIRDIKDTLSQAQRALDAYVRESADIIQLKFCLTYVHQVYGGLHMAGFHGAAMIASEVEALVQGLLDDTVPQKAEASDVLMKAIVQLSSYLEHALKAKRDQPGLVFSLLNDLRAVRGANFLSESMLFSPDLDYAHTVTGARNAIVQDEPKFRLMLSKLREMYQFSAASIIHNSNVEDNLVYLLKVSRRLQKILQGTQRFALWEIVAAFVTGLQEKVVPENASIKKLLRQLDAELKQLIEGGVSALDEKTKDEFLKNWLYYLSPLQGNTPEIDRIFECYDLGHASPIVQSVEDSDGIKPIESSAMRAVAKAILEEFVAVKYVLAQCHAEQKFLIHLDFVQDAFQRVADTLAILGVGYLRQEMLINISRIEELKENNEVLFPAQIFSTIEDSITDVEDELEISLIDSQASSDSASREFDESQEVALQESRNGLEEAKDAVVNYIATQWNIKNLQPVPQILRDVSNNLSTLSLTAPAEILSVCASYIEIKLINQPEKPKWDQLDSLADVIASIDYFLEVLSLTKEEDIAILKGAEKGLVSLGVPPSRVKKIIFGDEQDNDVAELDGNEPLSAVTRESDTSAKDAGDDFDAESTAEIIEIFTEEAGEVQQTIAEYLPGWESNLKGEEELIEIRRAFHTLKGSGRLVKAADIGELSWSVENMLNCILDKTLVPDQIQIDLIKKILLLFPSMVEAYSQQQATPNLKTCEQYQLWAHQLAKGEKPEDLLQALNESFVVDAAEMLDDDIDVQLWEIFGSEAETHLAVIREYIQKMEACSPFFEPPTDAMQRAMHTLKGSAYMAEIIPIAELMKPMELFAKDLRAYQVNIDDDILQLLKDSVTYTEDALEQVSRLMYPTMDKLELFLARATELRERSVGHLIRHEDEHAGPKVDPAFLEMLMHEGMNLLLDIDPLIAKWRHSSASAEDWQPVAVELAKVQDGAERANLGSMIQLSNALYTQYQYLIEGQVQASDHLYDVLIDAHYSLLDIIDAIAGGQDLPDINEELLQQLNALSINKNEQENVIINVGSSDANIDTSKKYMSSFVGDSLYEEVDEEIVEIFMEEAAELIEDIDEIIHAWEDGEDAQSSNAGIQRVLHTFKGGARLAGLKILGDLAHDFESYLIGQSRGESSANVITVIHQYQDQLIQNVDALDTPASLPESITSNNVANDEVSNADETVAGIELETVASIDDDSIHTDFVAPRVTTVIDDEVVMPSNESPQYPKESESIQPNISHHDAVVETHVPSAELSANENTNIVSFSPNSVAPVNQTETRGNIELSPNANTARRPAPQETVKVSADLMEELVNLAGETSISRGRMEEQMSDMGSSLNEMDDTVGRLQEQLRRLDIETEAQVIFRQEQLSEREDFDPLEMDRYSQLQQLSRSLTESASDLQDLKFTLSNKARDAETVLLQQSRINTELQEGLMRSRMVPFSRIVPRLRRIVRQIATELGKDVNFEFTNPEGELDRNMMERIVAPLEHMLRNAVDHGIEDTTVREEKGKPSSGRISLSLGREGGNVLLYLTDDGAGMNIDRIREKAIERQLMNRDAELSDQEILQFIFHAGFSTAETVTQISGRGVGMDVVSSEIKQLGGSVEIQSEEGRGTQFIVRLPFTLSVNRALMITMGDDRYAIPLTAIAGIARVPADELAGYYSDPDSRFSYADNEYQLQYLGTLLDKSAPPKVEGHVLPVPVLLVRSTDHSVAIQVDSLQGSREIVVKTLGAQFSSVQGLSGATIMGDGHVVVILDVYAMIRQQYALSHSQTLLATDVPQQQASVRNPLIMVVDDSVTVRKVTTRFLEREGFDVITAKDGVDAIATLQDHSPDLMLLDIEMPRMDGFEVAKRVRSSSRTADLPIIMITSRTGEKHRQTGLAAGANEYMGKPFQEDQLLKNISQLLTITNGLTSV